jgi:hypothetical protein
LVNIADVGYKRYEVKKRLTAAFMIAEIHYNKISINDVGVMVSPSR